MDSKLISELEKEQIEEWLFLKQECEECLSSTEAMRQQKQLVPIQEAEEPEEVNSEPVNSEPANSEPANSDNENDTDNESQRPDLADKLEGLMEEFRVKTDALILARHADYLSKHPKAVMNSQDHDNDAQQEPGDKGDERKTSIGGN